MVKPSNLTAKASLVMALIIALCSFCAASLAHTIASGHGVIRVGDRQTVTLLAMPAKALAAVDDNQDGLLQPQELALHRAEILSQLDRLFQLDVRASGGQVIQNDIMTSSFVGNSNGADQLDWIRTVAYPASLPANSPITVTLDRTRLDCAYRIKIEREDQVDAALLEPDQSEHVFFKNNWETFTSFFAHGVQHILQGADHVVFLVVLLLDKIRWRRWVGLLTAFTLAHGMTFGLATLNLVDAPVDIVEQLIAVSIILVAMKKLVNLQIRFRWELALVFLIGLVHGLGFASAMAGASAVIRFPVMTILGFNLGVELGQIMIACGLLVLVRLSAAMRLFNPESESAKWLAILPASIGLYWLFQRI